MSLKKIARFNFTEEEKEDLNKAFKRRKLGKNLRNIGSVAMLSSIPIEVFSKSPMGGKIGAGLAVGGAGSALTGIGLNYLGSKKIENIAAKKIKELKQMRKKQMGKTASAHKDHYDDAQMLCKVLDSMAAQAMELKEKIAEGHELPSWAEYKIYKAGDSIKSALSSTYSMKRRLMGYNLH